jgi:hypothetical protein
MINYWKPHENIRKIKSLIVTIVHNNAKLFGSPLLEPIQQSRTLITKFYNGYITFAKFFGYWYIFFKI